MRRGRSEESDLHAACSRPLSPLAFMLVINKRSQHERDIALHRLIISRDDYLVAFAREDCCQIAYVYARYVQKNFADIFGEARCDGISLKARAVAARDSIFVDRPVLRLQIGKHYD